jgi:hypothetical protein
MKKTCANHNGWAKSQGLTKKRYFKKIIQKRLTSSVELSEILEMVKFEKMQKANLKNHTHYSFIDLPMIENVSEQKVDLQRVLPDIPIFTIFHTLS